MSKYPVDFAELKQRVPILALCQHYGFKLKQVNADTWGGECLLPTHANHEEKHSFKTSVKKNAWNCFSDGCSAGRKGVEQNIFGFVRLMENLPTTFEAAKKVAELFPSGSNPVPQGNPNGTRSEPEPGGANKPLGFQLKDVNPEHPMIQERGITVETAKSFGVGFFPGKGSMSGRIVFPLYQFLSDASESPAMVGYCGRSVDGSDPKWRFPAGLLKNFLYGLERCDPHKPLVVVESPWAVLFLTQNGLQAAALMGSELTPGQELALAPFKFITLALDNDSKGREATEKIAARLKPNHNVRITYLKE